jgi:ABC-type glycerol-3-phosphate transport system substrate-binding protein
MQPKRTHLHLILILFAGELIGCAPGRPVPAPPPAFQGSHIRIVCSDPALARRLERQGRGWESRQQARIEVVAADQPRADTDIWVLAAPRLPQAIVAEQLQPLPESLVSLDNAFAWNGLLPTYRDRLLLWGAAAYAVPLVGDAPVLCYRGDLLVDPKHRQAFQQKEKRPLEPPQTWADVERIAAYFTAAGIPGLPPLSKEATELEQQFYTLAAAYACRARSIEETIPSGQRDAVFSFHKDLASGKPLVNSPGFVHALEMLQRFQKFRAKQSGSGEEAFRDGHGVLCLTQAWAVARFQDSTSKVRDQVKFCPVPAGEGWFEPQVTAMTAGFNPMVYLGGRAIVGCVLRASTNKEAAFALLGDLASRETSGQTVIDTRPGAHWAGGATRVEQLEERFRWDAFDLDPESTSLLKQTLRETVLVKRVKNPVFCLRVPDQELREKPMVEAIRSVLEGKDEPKHALDQVADEWARLDVIRGAEKARNEYRLSLGFRTQ